MTFAYRLRKRLALLDRARPGAPALVVADLSDRATAEAAVETARKLDEVSKRKTFLISSSAAANKLPLEPAALDPKPFYEAIVVTAGGAPAPLPGRLVSVLATLRLDAVRRIDRQDGLVDYARPASGEARRALFVYPGMFAPPRNGSHQRALSTVLDLVEDGFAVDVVVKRQSLKQVQRNAHVLALISANVSSYEVVDRPAPAPVGGPPAGFDERLAGDVDDGAKALVARLLGNTRYDLVVVSFPWMVEILDGADLNGARLVCDTHDVIFNRRREFLGAAGPLPGDAAMRERERACLARCDAALAISESDGALLRDELGLENVVVQPMAYYPAEPAAEWRATRGPLRFGFLGSDMEANRRALGHVLKSWWPLVERFSPESRLYVAGAVGRAETLWPYQALRNSVVSLGFVEDLDAFFEGVDVLLAPSAVQAGVNVKHVEALLRRRAVVTDALGARSLAPLVLPTVADSPAAFIDIVRRIDRNEPEMLAALDALFREAAAHHGKPRRLGWT